MAEEAVRALGDRIAQVAATIDAATHVLLTDIRAFDEAGGWYEQGALRCAHWLTWRIGLAPGAAREKVRVARALGELPAIDGALRQGKVSYSQMRAMTRVATSENEEALLEIARCSTAAQLEKICRLYRQTRPRQVERAKEEEDRRWMVARPTDDGMVRITVQLAADEAAVVMRAAEVSAEKGDLADGMVAMADAVLRGNAEQRNPVEVVVHVDGATLTGQLEDGTGVPAEMSRRLLCDSGVVPVLADEAGKTLTIGRKSRTVPAAMRRALKRRDGRCQFPGCTNRRWLDAHHVHHWANGGETSVENLIEVCRRHHRYVHEYGYAIRKTEAGQFEFLDPMGKPIPPLGERALAPSHPFDSLRSALADSGVRVSAETNVPGWDGSPVDYDLVISWLDDVDPVGRVSGAQ